MINNPGTPSSELQINFDVLQIDTENYATEIIHTLFERNRMYRLDAIVFSHIYAHTQKHAYIHHHKNSINEFRRPQNT